MTGYWNMHTCWFPLRLMWEILLQLLKIILQGNLPASLTWMMY